MMIENPVTIAIKAAGGTAQLAERFALSRQAILKWERGRVPAERVLEFERLTGIARYIVRPDIYPIEESTAA